MSIQSIWIILITSYIHWLWIVNSLTPKSLAHLVYSCVIEMFSLLVNTSTSLPKFILNMLVLREIPLKHWNTTQRADKTKVSRKSRTLFIMGWSFPTCPLEIFLLLPCRCIGFTVKDFFFLFQGECSFGVQGRILTAENLLPQSHFITWPAIAE